MPHAQALRPGGRVFTRSARISHETQAAVWASLFLCGIYVQNERMIYGYVRVSTDGQSVAAQVAELTAAGAEKLFRELASGAKADRAQLRRLVAALDAGDVLMATRLDRLARSTRDLLNTLAAIAGKGADSVRSPTPGRTRPRCTADLC